MCVKFRDWWYRRQVARASRGEGSLSQAAEAWLRARLVRADLVGLASLGFDRARLSTPMPDGVLFRTARPLFSDNGANIGECGLTVTTECLLERCVASRCVISVDAWLFDVNEVQVDSKLLMPSVYYNTLIRPGARVCISEGGTFLLLTRNLVADCMVTKYDLRFGIAELEVDFVVKETPHPPGPDRLGSRGGADERLVIVVFAVPGCLLGSVPANR